MWANSGSLWFLLPPPPLALDGGSADPRDSAKRMAALPERFLLWRHSISGRGPHTQEGGISSLSFSSFASSPVLRPASFAELICWTGLNLKEGRSALVTHCWIAAEQSEANAGYPAGFLSQGPGSGSAGWSCII